MFAAFTVTNTGDNGGVNPAANAGTGTLRQAIVDANANLGPDIIDFNLGTGTPSIALAAALPTITDPVTISGNTGGATRVELNGTSAGGGANGLRITVGNSTIEGLVINRFGQSGILLQTKGGNIIWNCYIGTNTSGTAALGNASAGIVVDAVPNNTIGGGGPNTRNLISGNGGLGGIFITQISATGNVISGNYIGVNITGNAAIPNTNSGIYLGTSVNDLLIGTNGDGVNDLAERNLISGNLNDGITFGFTNTATTFDVTVAGNYIGTDVSGTFAIPNNDSAVYLVGSGHRIGTNSDGVNDIAERNLRQAITSPA